MYTCGHVRYIRGRVPDIVLNLLARRSKFDRLTKHSVTDQPVQALLRDNVETASERITQIHHLAQAEFDPFAEQIGHLGHCVQRDRCVGGVQKPVQAGATGL